MSENTPPVESTAPKPPIEDNGPVAHSIKSVLRTAETAQDIVDAGAAARASAEKDTEEINRLKSDLLRQNTTLGDRTRSRKLEDIKAREERAELMNSASETIMGGPPIIPAEPRNSAVSSTKPVSRPLPPRTPLWSRIKNAFKK